MVDKRTNKQDGPFPAASFELKILSLSDEDLQNTFMWRTGLSDWVSAAEYKKSLEPLQNQTLPPAPKFDISTVAQDSTPAPAVVIEPEIIKPEPLSEASKDVVNHVLIEVVTPTASQAVVESESPRPKLTKLTPSTSVYVESKVKVIPKIEEKRRHARFEARLKCIIRTETISFRTFVKDISMTGLALENEIPKDILDKTCHIFITSMDGKENIKFKIQSTSRGELRFFSFDKIDEFTEQKLRQWIYALAQSLGINVAG
jgi:hypothetical protein